jgi:hypothetical protein
MAKITPQEAAEKWATNLGNATASIQRGIERVTEAPGPKAARRRELYVRKVQESSGKWAQRVGSVDLGTWQAAAINKGIPRIADGASKSQGKMADFMGELLPHVDSGRAKIDSMPKGSLADSKARAAAWIDHMAQFRRRGT